MSAQIIDGKKTAELIDAEAAASAGDFARRTGRKPGLAVVLIGDDPASDVYVRNKVRRAEAAGLHSVEIRKPASLTTQDALARPSKTVSPPFTRWSIPGIFSASPAGPMMRAPVASLIFRFPPA